MKPEPTFFHRLRNCGRFEPKRNQWLRILAGVMDNINCCLNCTSGIHTELFSLGTFSEMTELRLPDPQAIRTTIILLNGAVSIFEKGIPVAHMFDSGEIDIPLGGRFYIQAKTDFLIARLVIRTIRRCDCSNPRVYGEVEETPIGWQLL